MKLELNNTLLVPRGTPNTGNLELSMREVQDIESRWRELAYVTKDKAPELLQAFIRGYSLVNDMLIQVAVEYNQATKHADKRRAHVKLEVAPAFFKAKGLATTKSPMGSEDLRNSLLDIDQEFLDLQDKADLLKAVHEYLKGKARAFEMNYQSVKKIFDSLNGNLPLQTTNLDGTVPNNVEAGQTIETTMRIGKAKYG